MTPIKKLTITYTAPEDRLHLGLQMENGLTVRMWLTQRLARQVVSVLREQGGKLTPPAEPTPYGHPIEDVESVTGTDRGVASADATASDPNDTETPVAVYRNAPVWLIRNIVVTVGSDRLRLQFQSDMDIVPAAFLDRRLAAHWVGRIRKFFLIAGWPADLWTTSSEATGKVPRPSVTRH